MDLTFRPIQDGDVPFIRRLIKDSPEWLKEEGESLDVYGIFNQYKYLQGQWLVWKENNSLVGISFLVESAPSNNRPWIGTIIVRKDKRRHGMGSSIIAKLLAMLKQDGHKIAYAAVPIENSSWINFLTICGFEQYKIEKNEDNKIYLLFVCPLESKE
ncbi:GNAT family N-acetyltransferase [Bacillus salitolerans]|uniref:GNAT family N-acetyltransferase n=1 Tax=Bacillus salitolerans TaxID=1437434 RepID=A0ABW4LKD6_9BACI